MIRNNLDRSPMYAGVIEGIGPRYCPSIEDKVMRFADRNQHQIFLEPEGLTSNEIYPNGISTSLPFDVQMQIVRSMQGMENAKIVRPGYAIEYDFFDPRDLKPTLESKFIRGLFFAGQINGTTGYEEAAAQGLLAGLNAARFSAEKEGWAPARSQAYRAFWSTISHAGDQRTVPHVYFSCGISPDAARRQCRSASDRGRPRIGTGG